MSNVAQSPIEAQESANTPSPDAIHYLCSSIERLAELVADTSQSVTSVRGNMLNVSNATRANVESQFTHLHQAAAKSLREMGALLCQEIDAITTIGQGE
jgi:hypothetical protein